MLGKMTNLIENFVKLSPKRQIQIEKATRTQSTGDGANLWSLQRSYGAITGIYIYIYLYIHVYIYYIHIFVYIYN